jgi:hypothetical protein
MFSLYAAGLFLVNKFLKVGSFMDSVVMFQGTIYEKGYGQIARAVMRDKDLKLHSKAIYAYICSFASNSNSGEKTAFPSIELQCVELGMNEDTYYKYRKPLIEKGYLRIEKLPKEKGKFERNLYFIVAVPVPQNIGYGVNVDLEPFEPHPKISGTAEPHPTPSGPVASGPIESGTKTKSLKTNSFKKEKELISLVPSLETINGIVNLLKSLWPDSPIDEKVAEMIEEAKRGEIEVKHPNQFRGLLKSRLETWNATRATKPAKFKPIKGGRAEVLPDWFETSHEATERAENKESEEIEAKKRAIEEKLKAFRNK